MIPAMQAAPKLRTQFAASDQAEWPQDESRPTDEVAAPGWHAVTRGAALFFSLLALISVASEIRGQGTGANAWWIDLRPVSTAVVRGYFALLSMLLMAFALRPLMSPLRRGLTLTAVAALFVAALANAWTYYASLREGVLQSTSAVPSALHVAACLSVVYAGVRAGGWKSHAPVRDFWTAALTFALCVASLPMTLIFCAGKTDHRRAAGAIVVLGCCTGPAGAQSHVLAESVRTGCKLYRDKLAENLILCAADGDAEMISEIQRLAREMGVLNEAIILRRDADDPESAKRRAAEVFDGIDTHRMLLVGHYAHLPRATLRYLRSGWDVHAVPVRRQPSRFDDEARLLGYETVALWKDFLQPVLPPSVTSKM